MVREWSKFFPYFYAICSVLISYIILKSMYQIKNSKIYVPGYKCCVKPKEAKVSEERVGLVFCE